MRCPRRHLGTHPIDMIVAGYRVLPLGSTQYSRPSRHFESPFPPRSSCRNRYSYSDDDEPSAKDLTDRPTLATSNGDSLQEASLFTIQPSTREHPRTPASVGGDIRASEQHVRHLKNLDHVLVKIDDTVKHMRDQNQVKMSPRMTINWYQPVQYATRILHSLRRQEQEEEESMITPYPREFFVPGTYIFSKCCLASHYHDFMCLLLQTFPLFDDSGKPRFTWTLRTPGLIS